jgi:glycosyltransferase involved in cell wall biosynthesis
MTGSRDRRLKVCFVIPSLAGGGAERVAVQVLNALDGDRWERSMYLFARSGPFLGDVAPAVRLESAGTSSRVGRWRGLRSFVRRARPDAVVAFLSYLSVLTATRAARVGTRVIFDVETPVSAFLTDSEYRWSGRWNRRLFSAAMRIGCALADLIVATSRGVAEDLVDSFGAPSARVHVVPNPVDLPAVAAAAQEPLDRTIRALWQPPVIVAAGRLAEAKNYPLLIDAFALLRERIPASLFILGKGDEESALRQMIQARGLGDVVHLCGFQTNPWKYIARADVFALTSRYEGFGNVVVEAMACGVPIVATSSPGTRDIVSSGVDGLLVERHEPAAVADALAQVLTDGELRTRMIETAWRKVERYRIESVALTYDRVLTEALA